MSEPKKMISTRDLLYIEDLLSVICMFVKKIDHYDEEITDEKIKNNVAKVSLNLKDQYRSILEVLNIG